MFSFLNHVALFGLAGLAVPIWIHFFARPKPRVVDFPSTVFLSRVQIEHMKRIRLRELWLLILRCLAILFLVLAAARPSYKAGSGFSPTSFVFVVDNSLSLSREGMWPHLQAKADSALGAVRKGDELSLVWTSPPEVAAAKVHDPEPIRRMIEKAECGWGRGMLAAALDSASALLKHSTNPNRAVVLISDFQATEFLDSLKTDLKGIPVFAIPVTGDTANAAIVGARLENRILEPGSEARIRIEVANWYASRLESVVQINLNGEPAAQTVVTIEPGATKKLTLRVLPRTGWNEGEVRIGNDALAGDNVWPIAFFVPQTIRVLAAGDPSDVRSILLALSPGGVSGLFRIGRIAPGEPFAPALAAADVVHLCNWPSLTSSDQDALGRFVEAGGGVFFWFGSQVDLSDWDGWMRTRLGIRILGVFSSPGGTASLSALDFNQPLFAGIFDNQSERLRSVQLDRLVAAEIGKNKTLASASDKRPLLVEAGFGRGKTILFLSGLDPAWSGLALSTLFAPLVHRGTVDLAGTESHVTESVQVGEKTVFSMPSDYGKFYHIQTPGGVRADIVPVQKIGQDVFSWLAMEPGVYRFFRGDSLIGLVTASIDPTESDLRPASAEVVDSWMRVPIQRLEGGDVLAETAAVRFGRELWKESLILAVLCLLAEMAVARVSPTPRKKPQKSL